MGYVTTYSSLRRNDELAILNQLITTGPVAVGICGTDPFFMYYSKGVLSNSDCCITQNHALLIVGYG